jgi:hypothetical protein
MVHIIKNNPFYIKFFSSIEGYVHLFLNPILVFYITRNIRYSGLFFLLESGVRFSAYCIAGSFISGGNIQNIIKISYFVRYISIIFSLLIFSFMKENQFYFLLLNNIFFIIANCFYVTSIETLFQSHELFDKNVQSKLTFADLLSGSVGVFLILLFTLFKISYGYFIFINTFTFFCGVMVHQKFIDKISNISLKEWNRIFKNSVTDFYLTINHIAENKELLHNMFIGYIFGSFFLLIEQVNIFRFDNFYDDAQMKILHYSFKFIWFVSGSLFIPLFISKTQQLYSIFKLSLLLFFIGGILSIYPFAIFNFISALILGYAYHLIFAYRKIKRNEILKKSNRHKEHLGIFFAVEGLSGIFAFSVLSYFGKNIASLSLFFIMCLVYLFFYNKMVKD